MTGDEPASLDAAADASSGDRPARAPTVPGAGPIRIRRAPKPRMTGLLDSPSRNLTVGGLYTLSVMIIATIAYMRAGWSFRDAIYMVIVTVYTVGYN
jgi:hypothetical protein